MPAVAAAAAAAASPLTTGLGFAFAAASGVFIALQSGVNATLGAHAGQAFASVMSFATGLAACLIFFAVDVTALGAPLPTAAAVKAAPLWSWLGGPLGAFFVVSLIVFAPRLGAGSFISAYVCVQIVAAVTLDLIGAVGYVRRRFAWQRGVGVALLLAGVLLVTLYPGEPLEKAAAGVPGQPRVGRALTHLYARRPAAAAAAAQPGAAPAEEAAGQQQGPRWLREQQASASGSRGGSFAVELAGLLGRLGRSEGSR